MNDVRIEQYDHRDITAIPDDFVAVISTTIEFDDEGTQGYVDIQERFGSDAPYQTHAFTMASDSGCRDRILVEHDGVYV